MPPKKVGSKGLLATSGAKKPAAKKKSNADGGWAGASKPKKKGAGGKKLDGKKKVGVPTAEQEAKALFGKMDTDGDCNLSMLELTSGLSDLGLG